MNIKWLGHSAFLITADNGTRIITDPYTTGGKLSYGEIKETADMVTVSHGHGDHNNVRAVKGNPVVVDRSGIAEAKGIKITGIPSAHDHAGGAQRGGNIMFCFEVDGIRVCHLGDLGHLLDDKQAAALGKIDVLFIPVGGYYTIDAGMATKVVDKLGPRLVIPMHFKTAKCDFPITTVDDFVKGKTGVTRLGVSQADFHKEHLPSDTQVVVLEPAL
jgi:L-ascorbate metabolism protein UlaG (beta-lactamase superfamily)